MVWFGNPAWGDKGSHSGKGISSIQKRIKLQWRPISVSKGSWPTWFGRYLVSTRLNEMTHDS